MKKARRNDELIPVAASSSVLDLPAVSRADQHPVPTFLARLAAGDSRRSQRSALIQIAEWMLKDMKPPPIGYAAAMALPWWKLEWQHTNAIMTWLASTHAPATANRYRAALRGILKTCMRLRLMSVEQYTFAADIERARGSREPAGRALDDDEMSDLFGKIDLSTNKGRRDQAILAIAYGLRRAEVVGLDLSSVIGDSLKVIGKGNKERTVPLSPEVQTALKYWLEVRGDEPGPLFLPITKVDKIVWRKKHDGRMSPQAIYWILGVRAMNAKVASVSPHDMRRTFITNLLDQGAPVTTVQKIVGHTDPKTTSQYDRSGDTKKKAAVAALRVPIRQP